MGVAGTKPSGWLAALAASALAVAAFAAGCTGDAREAPGDGGLPAEPSASPSAELAPSGAPSPGPAPSMQPAPAPPRRDALTIIAGGDVSYGRVIGQMVLKDPKKELFAPLAPVLASGDLRFCNLESQLTDQKGETQSPGNKLVFCGPPEGAGSLALAGFDVVSTANNHAWDYGKKALFETMDHLDRAGVRYVGTGRDRASAYQPLVIDKDGFRLAMLAVTDIWNQGLLKNHPGADYVAGADRDGLAAAVRSLRADPSIDAIAVSYHGGCEYITEPITRTKEILRAAIDAGADVVIGHHPHVAQGVEWRGGRPILYSLGNLLMRMHSNHAWTGMSYLARIRLARGAPPALEACPYRIHGVDPLPFAGDPARAAYEAQFFGHLALISKAVGGTRIGPTGDDGCARLEPPVESAARD